MTAVALTSAGITEFADRLHGIAQRMDEEVRQSNVFGQSFLGPWGDFLGIDPWTEPPPRGLFSLVDDIQSFTHIVAPLPDFQRLRRFERRLQELWDLGTAKGQNWQEPRPETSTPGSSGAPASSQAATIAFVLLGLYLFTRKGD